MNMDQFKLLGGEVNRIAGRISERKEELDSATEKANASLNQLKTLIQTDGINETLSLLQTAITTNARKVNETFAQITQFINTQRGLHEATAQKTTTNIQNIDSILGNIKATPGGMGASSGNTTSFTGPNVAQPY